MDSFAFPGLFDYELLDSGDGEKLERFGEYVLRRPDPQALWRPHLDPATWAQADYGFVREDDRGGRWKLRDRSLPKTWEMQIGDGFFRIHPTPFKHVGVFPEQACNWAWVEQRRQQLGKERPRLLNLFGYTAVASVLAARKSWFVTHLDASKASLDWAAANAKRNQVAAEGIRWVLEDALKFVQREVRRGNTYHGILLDPPHYGRGPKGEKWQFETGIAALLEACYAALATTAGSFLILSTYAIGFSPIAFENMLHDLGDHPHVIESGELWLPEGSHHRRLPCGFCARWTRA